MGNFDGIFGAIDVLGTIAFAISGSMVAIEKKNDIFGVLLLGLTTAVGGGIIRDLVLGHTPPRIFEARFTLAVAFFTSFLVFILAYYMKEQYQKSTLVLDRINNVFDALGLGAFTVTGMQVAMQEGNSNVILILFAGCLTGIGGGLTRDLMVNEIPFVLRKYVYAVASIMGGILYWVLLKLQVSNSLAMVAGIALVFVLRILATVRKWNLPRVVIDKD